MYYDERTLIQIITCEEYDDVATEFLEIYYPDALMVPQCVPILKIAKEKIKLDVQFISITEEHDVYGLTVFQDGFLDIYKSDEEIYESKYFKKKTILIDPKAVAKSNTGCMNNTIAHECVHWYKHRLFYKMQSILLLPRQAKYCKFSVKCINTNADDELILENQANEIAPRILMPKRPFIEVANKLNVGCGRNDERAISELASFFDVSKQSASIRLQECMIM